MGQAFVPSIWISRNQQKNGFAPGNCKHVATIICHLMISYDLFRGEFAFLDSLRDSCFIHVLLSILFLAFADWSRFSTVGRARLRLNSWRSIKIQSTLEHRKGEKAASPCQPTWHTDWPLTSNLRPSPTISDPQETEFFSHVDYTLKMNMYDFPPSSEVEKGNCEQPDSCSNNYPLVMTDTAMENHNFNG